MMLDEPSADAPRPERSAAPLPEPLSPGGPPTDGVIEAWRLAAQADHGGDASSRAEARVRLADAWLELDAAGPAAELLRAVESIEPRRNDVLERRASVLLRSGQLREWAQQCVMIARRSGTAEAWETAARAWVRAGELEEAATCADALVRASPSRGEAFVLQGAIARLRAGLQRGEVAVEALLEAAHRARQTDRLDAWRSLSIDAWIESHGARGGALLVEALAASGHPRAAVYVAVETAAREVAGGVTDDGSVGALLARAARLAESAAMLGEATAAWTVASLLPNDRRREAREALRDLLAERGRVMDLAARLRADARRAQGSAAVAAWKGVAAVELPVAPTLAVQALFRALAAAPEDPEALELLRALEGDPSTEEAMRDGAWSLLRSSCPRGLRGTVLRWLGALEERFGDPGSALLAWAAIDEPRPEVFEAVARVHEAADREGADAAAALAELAATGAQSSLSALLDRFAARPGAFVDLRALTRALGPLAGTDPRAARLWWQVASRRGDGPQFVAVARRVASHAPDEALRLRALHACADALSDTGAEETEVAELVSLLLDERPGDPHLAAMLAALAEQSRAPSMVRDALAALVRAVDDPWERGVLSRFCREPEGEFAVLASCLAEPAPSPARAAHLAHLNELVGDSGTLLGLRTRALLSQPGVGAEALAVARRFAAFDPLSAEAAIAWFGAAGVAGDGGEIAEAALAVTRSLATSRDIAAVSRTAVSRLLALELPARAAEVALVAARCGALSDRGLRSTVIELGRRADPPVAARLLESALAIADPAGESSSLLLELPPLYERSGHEGAALGAWLRASAHAPGEALPHLLRLAPRVGDRVWNAQLLAQQLDSTLDVAARRRLLLSIAAEYAAADPPRVVDAMGALDRIVSEHRDPEARELVVRAMLSLAQTDAAIGRLSRWAVEQADPAAVSSLLLRAARLASDGLADAGRALGLLRVLLRHDPSNHEALHIAEEIAQRAGHADAMLAIYADLLGSSPGPHGRYALRYRRATLYERTGDYDSALRELIKLFEERPGTGAVLTALERVARRLSRFGELLRAVELLAGELPPGIAQAKAFRRAAEIARESLRDPSLALQHALRAYRATSSDEAADALRAEVRALRAEAPSSAEAVIDALVDEQLASGNQCWDDDARRARALRALEIGVADGRDVFRVAAAVGLYLRQHGAPEVGARTVAELVARVASDPVMRDAALQAPAMRAIERSGSVGEGEGASVPRAEPATSPPADADVPASDGPDPQRPSWTPSSPPRTSVAQFDDATLMALRSAAAHGNDAAASVLASRLSSAEDLRDEALSVQRRRFQEDPGRVDALEAMVALYQATRRAREAGAITQVLLVLQGRSETVIAPELSELSDPPEGVSRVVFPPRFGPYPELGGMLWEVLAGAARRQHDRARFQGVRRVVGNSALGRATAAAARLLQLPRATSLALREALAPAWELDPSTSPATVILADRATEDPARFRDILGLALEASRVGHLPITAFPEVEADRWVRAVAAAFSSPSAAPPTPPEPAISALAGQLLDGLPARMQRRMSEVVSELGDGLTYESWKDRVSLAQSFAGLLLCGAFGVSAARLIDGSPHAGATASRLIAEWEPLRELARFAVAEEYLLVRWSSAESARRRR